MTPSPLYDTNAEISGSFLNAVVGAMNLFEVKPFLAKHNLDSVDPNTWYPIQDIIDFYKELEDNGKIFNMVAVGVNTSDMVQFPPDVETLADALERTVEMYHSSARNGRAGVVELVLTGERTATLRVETPFPADMIYGIFYGIVKRFTSDGSSITVNRRSEDGATLYDMVW